MSDLLHQTLNTVHATFVFRRRVRVLAGAISAEIGDARSVLDVGCGDGSIAKAISDIRPLVDVRGIDTMSRPSVHIPVDLYDGTTLPYEDRSVDWVALVDVLHHTDDPVAVINEAARVSRRGVVIKDHLLDGFVAGPTLRFMDWVGNQGHGVALPYNYLTRARWEEVFEEAGVEVASWTDKLGLYPVPFNLVFERDLHFLATVTRR